MIIREMRTSDVEEVMAIEKNLFTDAWEAQGFIDTLANPDAHFIVAENEEGHVAGYCGYYQALDEAEIVNVAVDRSLQNGGIGLQLVNRLMDDAMAAGVNFIILEVRLSNDSAKHVYEKAGFESLGIRKRFYSNPTEDAVIMRWERSQ